MNSCVVVTVLFKLAIDKIKKKIYLDAPGDVTYGIRAGVETLGPNWAQNAPTGFTLELHGY